VVRRRQDQRGLISLLFTDIVSSSQMATDLGDRRWKNLQARHHAEVRRHLKRYGGHEVDTAGDGFFATFASPESGVRCAFAIVQGVRELGLDVRAGLHIGVAELSGEKVSGIAVTTAARVSAVAGPAQVLATDTIVHMVTGSGFDFTDLGSRELKGVPGRWELFSLDAVDGESIGLPLDPQQAVEYRELASPAQASSQSARLRLVAVGLVALALLAGVLVFEQSRSGPGPEAAPSVASVGPIDVVDVASGQSPFSVSIQGAWATDVVLTPSKVGPATQAWVRFGDCGALNACPAALVNLNGDSGALEHRYGFDPLGLAEANGRVWLLINRGTRVFAERMDPDQNRPTDPIFILNGASWRSAQVLRVAMGGNALWVADTNDRRVYRLSLSSGTVKRYPVESGVDDIAFGGGFLWVMDRVGAELTRIDPVGGKPKTESLSQLDTLSSLTFGGGYIWATDDSADEVWRVTPDLNAPTPVIVGDAPDDVIYADGMIWVANKGDKTVSEIDPRIPSVTTSLPVAVHPVALAVRDGKVWAVGVVPTSYG
jgi:class 3 adenylate cyclase